MARTASRAMNNIVLPIVTSIARHGSKETCRQNVSFQKGIYIHNGNCVNKDVAEIFDFKYHEFKCE